MCWSLVLVDDVLMDRFSFSSTFVRYLSAVCRLFVVSSTAVLCCIQFSFWCCDFVFLFLVAVAREIHWHISLDEYEVLGCLLFGAISFTYISSFMEWIGSTSIVGIGRIFLPTNAHLCFWYSDCDPLDYTRCKYSRSLWNCYAIFVVSCCDLYQLYPLFYQFLIVVGSL